MADKHALVLLNWSMKTLLRITKFQAQSLQQGLLDTAKLLAWVQQLEPTNCVSFAVLIPRFGFKRDILVRESSECKIHGSKQKFEVKSVTWWSRWAAYRIYTGRKETWNQSTLDSKKRLQQCNVVMSTIGNSTFRKRKWNGQHIDYLSASKAQSQNRLIRQMDKPEVISGERKHMNLNLGEASCRFCTDHDSSPLELL